MDPSRKNKLSVLKEKAVKMDYLGIYLLDAIVILLLMVYFKLVYKCKRGVELSIEKLKKTSKITLKENLKSVEVLPQAPGPIPWPVIGNLALLGQYDVPFEGFSEIAKTYGDVYSLTLGTTRCVIVNCLDTMKEVLNENGLYFGGRPNFEVRKGAKNLKLQWNNWKFIRRGSTGFSVVIEIIVSSAMFSY